MYDGMLIPHTRRSSHGGRRRPSSPRFLAGVRDIDRRFEAAVKTAVFLQKVDQVEDLADYARLTGLE